MVSPSAMEEERKIKKKKFSEEDAEILGLIENWCYVESDECELDGHVGRVTSYDAIHDIVFVIERASQLVLKEDVHQVVLEIQYDYPILDGDYVLSVSECSCDTDSDDVVLVGYVGKACQMSDAKYLVDFGLGEIYIADEQWIAKVILKEKQADNQDNTPNR